MSRSSVAISVGDKSSAQPFHRSVTRPAAEADSLFLAQTDPELCLGAPGKSSERRNPIRIDVDQIRTEAMACDNRQ